MLVVRTTLLSILFCGVASAIPPPGGPPTEIPADYPGAEALTPEQFERFNELLPKAGSARDAYFLARSTKDWDVATLLRNIVLDKERPARERSLAVFWLGMTHDDSGPDAFRQILDQSIAGDAISEAQYNRIRTTIYGMGFCGNDDAVETLFEWMRPAFWEERLPPLGCPEMDYDTQYLVRFFRRESMHALSNTGTLAAIHALATGEGIPKDMRPSGLGWAVSVKAGIMGEPYDPEDIPLFKRIRREAIWNSVHRKYGTFEEIAARLDAHRSE